jgi:hypothetical protein
LQEGQDDDCEESATLDTDLSVAVSGRRTMSLGRSPARKRKLSKSDLFRKRTQTTEIIVGDKEKLSKKRNHDEENEEVIKLRAEMARITKRHAVAAAKSAEANEKQQEKYRLLRINLKNKEAQLKEKEVTITDSQQLSGSKRTISVDSDMTDTPSLPKISKTTEYSLEKEKEKEYEQQIYETRMKSIEKEKELEQHAHEAKLMRMQASLDLAVALEKVGWLFIR